MSKTVLKPKLTKPQCRGEIYLLCFLRQFSAVVFSNSHQVVRRYILGSIVDSEKNYVDALKRILEVPKCRERSGCVL